MSKILRIKVLPPAIPLDGSYTHTSTDWEIAKYPDFINPANILLTSLTDTTNMVQYDYIVTDPTLPYYGRVRFNYSNNTSSTWSKILILRPDQTTTLDTSINVVQTPTVTVAISGSNLSITTPALVMYYGSDTHASTSWYIRTPDDKLIYSSINDTVHKTNLTVPISTLQNDKIYLVQAVHNTTSGIKSQVSEILFKNDLVYGNIFIPTKNNKLYNDTDNIVLINTVPNFLSTDLILEDDTGTVIKSNYNQTTTEAILNVGLLEYQRTYTLKARVQLTDNTYSSYKVIFTGQPEYIFDIAKDQYTNYLEKFNNTDSIDTNGQTVQISNESVFGNILIAKQNSSDLFLYKHYRGKLSDIKPALTLDNVNIHKDKQYVNITQLLNGDVLIDYDELREVHDGSPIYNNSMVSDAYLSVIIDGAKTVKYRPVFAYYKYHKTTNTYTFVNKTVRDTELYGTAPTNSLVVIGRNAYYIPTEEVTSLTDHTNVQLSLKKLNLDTMVVSAVTTLPVSGIYTYANLDRLDNDNLFFANGSGLRHDLNANNATGTTEYVHDRVNNDIYHYNITNNTWSLLTTMPASVAVQNYDYQSFLRKDNKIVMFNSVYSGSERGIQNTIVYNPGDNTVVENTNDTPDNLIFRNTISLQNGDFLRISDIAKGAQVVDTYVSDTYAVNQIITNVTSSLLTVLTVNAGEHVTIEDPYRYLTIDVLGTNAADTGTLEWIDGDVVKVFHYNDLLLPSNRTISGTSVFNSITLLPGAVLTSV